MARMALLIHPVGDGTNHYLWLVERPAVPGPSAQSDATATLVFRTLERVDDKYCRRFCADRLEDRPRDAVMTRKASVAKLGDVRNVAGGMVRRVEQLDESTISIRGRFLDQDEYIWACVKQGDLWNVQRSDAVLKRAQRTFSPEEEWDIGPDHSDGF